MLQNQIRRSFPYCLSLKVCLKPLYQHLNTTIPYPWWRKWLRIIQYTPGCWEPSHVLPSYLYIYIFNNPPYKHIKKEQHTINYIKQFATVNINLYNTTFILPNSWHIILNRETQLVLTNSVLSCVVSLIHHLPKFL